MKQLNVFHRCLQSGHTFLKWRCQLRYQQFSFVSLLRRRVEYCDHRVCLSLCVFIYLFTSAFYQDSMQTHSRHQTGMSSLLVDVTASPMGSAEHCDEHVSFVCLCVCLSMIISPELRVRSSPNFLCTLPMPSVLWRCWLGGRKGIRPVKKTERWGAGVVVCMERGADLHMAQLMPLPLTVSCFSKIQIGFTFLVPAHPVSPGKRGR